MTDAADASTHDADGGSLARPMARLDRNVEIRDVLWVNPDRNSEDPIRILLGNMRAEMTSRGQITFADHHPVREFDAATLDAHGQWVFVTRDGCISTSETFLGTLRRVQDTTRFGFSVSQSVGSLSLTNTFEQSYIITSRGAVQWPRFGSTGMLSIGPSRGAYLDLIGDPWLIDAQGQQRRIRLGDEQAKSFSLIRGQLHMHSDRGVYRVHDDGTLHSADPNALAASTLPSRTKWAVVQAMFRRWPSRMWWMVPPGTVSFESVFIRLGDELAQVAVNTRTISHIEPIAPNRRPCDYRVWGPNLIRSCGDQPQPMLRFSDGREASVSIPKGSNRIQFSEDGIHAVAAGACTEQEVHVAPVFGGTNQFCVTNTSGVQWETVAVPHSPVRALDIRGSIALLGSAFGSPSRLLRLETDSGELSEVPPSPSANTGNTFLAQARFTAEGEVWAVQLDLAVHQMTRTIWNNGGQIEFEAVGHPPHGMQAMIDRTTVIGLSDERFEWWLSSDSAATFQQFAAVHPETLLHTFYCGDPIFSPVLQCSPYECVSERRNVVSLGIAEHRILPAVGTEQSDDRRYFRRPGWSSPSRLGDPRCVLHPDRSRRHPPRMLADGTIADLDIVWTDSDGWSFRGRWIHSDAPSQPHPVVSGSLQILRSNADREIDPNTANQQWHVAHATTHWLLLERCGYNYQTACDHVLLSELFQPQRVEIEPGLATRIESAVALPGDHHALLFRDAASNERQVAVLMNPSGAILFKKHIFLNDNATQLFPHEASSLAIYRDAVGVVRTERTRDETLADTWFYPLFREAVSVHEDRILLSTNITRITTPPRRCTSTASSETLVLQSLAVELQPALAQQPPDDDLLTIPVQLRAEFAPTGQWCIRSAGISAPETVATASDETPDQSSVSIFPGHPGSTVLEGAMRWHNRRYRFSCH